MVSYLQSREAPLPSALSISGLLIHCAQVVHGWLVTSMRAPEFIPVEDYPQISAEIGIHGMYPPDAFPEDDSLQEILGVFDRVVEFIDHAAAEIDLDAELPNNPPWLPDDAALTGRWVWLHLITEVARHAGHADLIREALDGQKAEELNEQVDGGERA
ncbi:mycothiol transferase [Brevibacterium daeguense]|uniref:mycothiol transferase n=1 Tax=Brevibacterium daeguense TaxID=909936 RepID=UPI0023511E6E|nr:DUF664 domain-containing protein [Brevibacterium daeguense]